MSFLITVVVFLGIFLFIFSIISKTNKKIQNNFDTATKKTFQAKFENDIASRKSKTQKIRENNQRPFNLHEFRQSLKEKGDSYEKYVSGYFRGQGYTIAEHGLDNGRKDHGIDVIVKKHKEIIFVQCKNWKVSDKHKIDHRHIKEFIGNCTTYMEKNPMYGMYAVKRYFAVSDEIMDYSAERFISENPQSIQKLLLTMPEE